MLLDARLRRLTTYLYLQDLLPGAAVLEVGAEGSDELLQKRGARKVTRASVAELPSLAPGEEDVVFAIDVEPEALPTLVPALRRLLRPDGTLVLSVESRDRPGARRGVSYYELHDLFAGQFPSLKMMGQAPFAGATLVEYGDAEPALTLDGTLLPKGERVQWYVVVAGKARELRRGYGVVQVPIAEVAALPAERRVAEPAAAPQRPPVAAPPVASAPVASAPAAKGIDEIKERLAQAEKGKAELQEFVLRLKHELAERDAYVAELDGERRELGRLRERTREAEARADKAEAQERDTRKRLAETEGKLRRAASASPTATTATTATATETATGPDAELDVLRAEVAKWKERESDARAEAWKAHKARSDAEAQAAEVREDTVRKLKDARKLASVELTRATEEAMKKAVSLKEELTRTERERKQLVAEVKRLTELAQAAASAPPPPPAADGGRVAALERELMNADAIAAADRARSAQLVADLEREAGERADALVRLRNSLRQRDREVAELRHELSERDARLTALERRTPAVDEIDRLEMEIGTARMRLGNVTEELAKKEAQVERAAAAAAHERARAERMMQSERHAVESLNEARTRAANAERQLDVARERLARMELELAGEAERMNALEQAARRAAESVRQGNGA